MSTRDLVTALFILATSLTAGCGGGGAGGGGDVAPGEAVQVQIWNRSDRTMVVFARWGNAPRVRLGQLSGSRRGSYTTAVQGPTLAISWDIVSGSPPPGTADAGAAFPSVADGTGNPLCPVSVTAGDRIEWTIDSNARSCSYVRLDPASD